MIPEQSKGDVTSISNHINYKKYIPSCTVKCRIKKKKNIHGHGEPVDRAMGYCWLQLPRRGLIFGSPGLLMTIWSLLIEVQMLFWKPAYDGVCINVLDSGFQHLIVLGKTEKRYISDMLNECWCMTGCAGHAEVWLYLDMSWDANDWFVVLDFMDHIIGPIVSLATHSSLMQCLVIAVTLS